MEGLRRSLGWPSRQKARGRRAKKAVFWRWSAVRMATLSKRVSRARPALTIAVIGLRRGPSGSAAGRVRLAVSPKADGSSPLHSASFPLLAETCFRDPLPRRASASPPSASSTEGASVEFSIESIGSGPTFKGIDGEAPSSGVSDRLHLVKAGDVRGALDRAALAGLEQRERSAGLLLDYGPSLREPRSDRGVGRRGVSGIIRSSRSRPDARTVLDAGLLSPDAAISGFAFPRASTIRASTSPRLWGGGLRLADLGRVLLSKAPIPITGLSLGLAALGAHLRFQGLRDSGQVPQATRFFAEKLGFRGTSRRTRR